MARQIVDLEGLTEILPFTRHQAYKMVRRAVNPLPHKKLGRRLLFDLERVFAWYDSLPGRDETM